MSNTGDDSAHRTSAERGEVLVLGQDVAGRFRDRLGSQGYSVEISDDTTDAIALVRDRDFDVVISESDAAGGRGVELLRRLRQHDDDLPVVLVGEVPDLPSALEAIEYSSCHYVLTPVQDERFDSVVARAVDQRRRMRAQRAAVARIDPSQIERGERLVERFANAISTLWAAHQPIISWTERTVYAYEVLMRNREPSLQEPAAFLGAAERLGRLHELGRLARRGSAGLLARHPGLTLFVNLHTYDLADEQLYSPQAELGPFSDRVVLEITERTALENVPDFQERVGRLRAAGYRIAVDDLGSGYAGLSSIALLEPDFVKLDMSLVRDLNRQQTNQKLVAAMIRLTRDLGKSLIAEGVETEQERDTLVRLGVDLMQGYLFGRPHPDLAKPRLRPCASGKA